MVYVQTKKNSDFMNYWFILFYIAGVVETVKGTIQLSKSTAATARILLFFDQLFDSFNRKQD